MSLYRRVSLRMWGDDKYLSLSKPLPNARYLFIYLFTGPHTSAAPGIFQAGERQLTEALQWPLRAFRRCFGEIQAHGMATADWDHRVVYLPRAKFHNPPMNPNIIKAWSAAFADLPECALTVRAWNDFAEYGMTEGFSEAFRDAFGKAFRKASPNSSGIGIGIGIGSGSGSRKGFDALTASRNSDRPQPSRHDQLAALAQREGLSLDELKAKADEVAKQQAARRRH
jgi:hypothetical protein